MEFFMNKYRSGIIDLKTYEKMIEVVDHLASNEYTFIEEIGSGSYGSVLKVKDLKSQNEFAAKIVQKNFTSEGELVLWKNLEHEHILQLRDIQFAYYADSYIFFTPVYPYTLEQKIFECSFVMEFNALTQAITWLKEIVDAVTYLHEKGLSHNDIKCNNIFISDTNSAVLADFGFLTSSEKPIRKYGAPFIYRCPEGKIIENGLTEIDGQKLDVWTVGMIAYEMLTKMSLLTEISKENRPLKCWFTDLYPKMQNNLQKTNFIKLLQKAFPASQNINEVVDDILDFITSCLNVIPNKRPHIVDLKKHKLFGGSWKKDFDNQVYVWNSILSVPELNVILRQNGLETIPEIFAENCFQDQRNESFTAFPFKYEPENQKYRVASQRNTSEKKLSCVETQEHNGTYVIPSSQNIPLNGTYTVGSQQCMIGEQMSSYGFQSTSTDNIDENILNNIVDTVSESIPTPLRLSEVEDSYLAPYLDETNKFSSKTSSLCNSVPIQDPRVSENFMYDFEIEHFEGSHVAISQDSSNSSMHSTIQENYNENVISEEDSNDNLHTTQKLRKGQTFRIWWKRQKFAACRIFSACCPCVKK